MATWTCAGGAWHTWNSLVRCYAESIPAVRHLTVALASRQQDVFCRTTERADYASSQYAQALSWLARAKDAAYQDILLICCLLIGVYEHINPKGITDAGLSHCAAASRIFNDPATKWTPATRAIYAIAQQVEAMVSILKSPIMLPATAQTNFVEQHLPVLPEQFSTPAEMQRKFYEIIRWRFLYSTHNREWTRRCSGFLRVRDLMCRWHTLVCNYLSGVTGTKPVGQDLQLATTISAQYRMVYVALLYSVSEQIPGHQHPGHANLVDLSNPDQVTVSVPVQTSPRFHDQDMQLMSGKSPKVDGIWPDFESIRSSDDPLYIRFTLSAKNRT